MQYVISFFYRDFAHSFFTSFSAQKLSEVVLLSPIQFFDPRH
jgi:hypothetical protein